MTDSEKNQNHESSCCTVINELYAADLIAPLIDDLASITEAATIDDNNGVVTRGQNVKECPTPPLPLHMNLTKKIVNVTGDLVVDQDSCKVKISWAPGRGGAAIFPPGTNIKITVPLAPGFVLNGHCVETKDKKRCKWSWT